MTKLEKNDNTNQILKCLGRYSKTNLAMMIFDGVGEMSEDIWQLAERDRRRKLIAGNDNLQLAVRLAQSPFYDGILYRTIENLDDANQVKLAETLTKLKPCKKVNLFLRPTISRK